MEIPRASRRVEPLPDHVIDQIAAGEVVERPASVVKELVENALDAGARRVRVEVRGGGRDWICVSDDGLGMSAEDARLALLRHATSKIRSGDDLARIQTFGFRGEALPAIASVSRLRLRTRERGAASAFEIRVEAGRKVGEGEAAGPEGTRVEVADLFASVPARRKFLKSATTEWGHVADWLALAALALPEVHFDVKSDDRPSLSWPAARSLGDRVAAVLSERVARTLVPAERSEGSLHVRGFVSRADQHRATAGALHFFVNGRPVRDRLLRHALLESYRDVLPRGRFPTAVLFVELPPGEVDVNVHPAKWEVRFADPMAMHRLVRAALRDALAGAPRAPGAVSYARPAPRLQVRETTGPTDWVWAAPAGEPAQLDLGTSDTPGPRSAPLRFSELRCVGQVLGTYLALEAPDGLVLVDQHAAHERVLFERLRAQRLEGAIERQALLFPLTLELDPAGGAALLSRADEAAALGFEIEPFGGSATRVRAVPALLAERDPGALVRHLAETLAEAEATGAETSAGAALSGAESAIASLACHAARRAGDILDPREQRALLDALDAIPWRPTCPHGRPVALTLGVAEIERRFGRDYRF